MVGVINSIHGSFLCSLPSLQPVHSSSRSLQRTVVVALKSPKGFGPPSPTPSSSSKSSSPPSKSLSAEQQQQQRRKDPNEEDDEIPELVTDRMLKRIGVAVGIPLSLGLLFFPLFWYLKVVLKVDVPEWLPLLVSGLFFGMSGIGITYGIVSTSWDPLREGSVLGWKEAQANWPLFFQNLQSKQERKFFVFNAIIIISAPGYGMPYYGITKLTFTD